MTPFLTKLRSSLAARSTRGKASRNGASPHALSCAARLARSAKAARFTNSSRRTDHSSTFFQACVVRSKSAKQTVSVIAQLSNWRTQRSICAAVTCAGSSM